MKTVSIKRIYEEASEQDGYRILVDRLWPRGISKEKAKLDEWDKELAPSTDLRKWFDHEDEKFPDFRKRYFEELKDKDEAVERLRGIAAKQKLTLLYSAKNTESNQAVVLRDYILKKS